jgi:basic membrane lipoprotein Med (substrate-binding protein (PBP1-ABC) superfamily)
MRHRRTWIIGLLSLAAVWAVALTGMAIARSRQVTPEKVIAFVNDNPLKEKSPQDREKFVRELADKVNRLSFEQRQQMRDDKPLWQAFEQMNDTERKLWLDLTLSRSVKKMMLAFNDMSPSKRKELVDEALQNMKKNQRRNGDGELGKRVNDENMKRIVDEGMKAFMTDANAATKIDLQPLIEQMQRVLQMERNP